MRIAIAVALLILAPGACEQRAATPQATGASGWTPAERDVTGTWVVAAHALDAAAENIVRNQAERAGERLTDAQVRQRAQQVAQVIERAPAEFTFQAGGAFTSRSGQQTASGTWTLESDIVTVESPDALRPRRFRVTEYELINLPATDDLQPVTLVRK